MEKTVTDLNLKKEPEHFDASQQIEIKTEKTESYEAEFGEDESLSHQSLHQSPELQMNAIEEIYVQQDPLKFTDNEQSSKRVKMMDDSIGEGMEEEKPLDFSGYQAGLKVDCGIATVARAFNIEDLIDKNIVNEFLNLKNGEAARLAGTENVFSCSLCPYETKLKQRLATHMRLHTGDTFKCELCPYESIRKSDLKRHHRTHSGEKNFKCDVCSYCSSRSSDIKRHLRTHTGEKPFKCTTCPFSSATSSHLKTHLRVHTGEKPFKCSVCAFSSSQSSHLRTHFRSHTGEKPFECGFCSFTTAQNSHLRRHLKCHFEKKERRRKQKKGQRKIKGEKDATENSRIQSHTSSLALMGIPRVFETKKEKEEDVMDSTESSQVMDSMELRPVIYSTGSTATRQITDFTESRRLADCTDSRQVTDCTESRQVTNSTDSRQVTDCTDSREVTDCTETRQVTNSTDSSHKRLSPDIPLRLSSESEPKHETENQPNPHTKSSPPILSPPLISSRNKDESEHIVQLSQTGGLNLLNEESISSSIMMQKECETEQEEL